MWRFSDRTYEDLAELRARGSSRHLARRSNRFGHRVGTIWAPDGHRDLRPPLGTEELGEPERPLPYMGTARFGHRRMPSEG